MRRLPGRQDTSAKATWALCILLGSCLTRAQEPRWDVDGSWPSPHAGDTDDDLSDPWPIMMSSGPPASQLNTPVSSNKKIKDTTVPQINYASRSTDSWSTSIPSSSSFPPPPPLLSPQSPRSFKASAVAADSQALAHHALDATSQVVKKRAAAVGALQTILPNIRNDPSASDSTASLLQSRRSLQDWQIEDFVLLATVDGSIHARDRKTGASRWQLHVDHPMVETIYHHQNTSLFPDFTSATGSTYDFLWIVEPSRDGDIYIYNQATDQSGSLRTTSRDGPRADANPRAVGLQKLQMTVKQLVADMSPYESVDPAVVYNGEKKTRLYTVDAETGTINKVFGAPTGLHHEPRCPRPGGLSLLDDDERRSGAKCGSSGTFVLGRTEYTISIQDRDTTEPICTIKYSEWGPNTRDGDLHSQYVASMDGKYIYPLHDGSILGWQEGSGKNTGRQKSYIQKLPSPVVRVFDVARPIDAESEDSQLVILPQPLSPLDSGLQVNAPSTKDRIFINHTESGGWFAMSETSYPFVAGKAKQALCYDEDWREEVIAASPPVSLARRQESFVGVHALATSRPDIGTPLTISDHANNARYKTPYDQELGIDHDMAEQISIAASEFGDDDSSLSLSLPPLASSRIITSLTDNVYDILIIVALAFVAYLYYLMNRRQHVPFFANIKLKNPLLVNDQTVPVVPVSPTVMDPAWPDEAQESEATAEIEQDGQAPAKILTVETTAINDEATQPGHNDAEDRLANGPRVRFDGSGDQVGGTNDGKTVTAESQDTTPVKKKARRGARGGVKHSKKKLRQNGDHANHDAVDDAVKCALIKSGGHAPDKKHDGDQAKVIAPTAADMNDPSVPLQLGHLIIYTDCVLGFGGHGTVVYKGRFGGRDVAVKRMLREFYDIASHEVGLLQESDDHPNVIRYYDKEEDHQFFYIALELCPASLQDVIERPHDYPLLVGPQLDKPEILRQIVNGLGYLHSLKIVHRDIKPQNILVSAPRANALIPTLTTMQPRLLISDFGLCKKLEADQNSFRATTAHAAGTSGWRAPELLIDDDPSSKPNTTITSNTDTSEPLVIDTQTKRSATRAIDIFSLGCIFYYCLTNGGHPFDTGDRYMREANIVKGTYNIDALGCLGDYQWEAKNLIEAMLCANPKLRPDATTILRHPFFWSAAKRLDFLCDVSDGFEHEKYELDMRVKQRQQSLDHNETRSEYIEYLESRASQVLDPAYLAGISANKRQRPTSRSRSSATVSYSTFAPSSISSSRPGSSSSASPRPLSSRGRDVSPFNTGYSSHPAHTVQAPTSAPSSSVISASSTTTTTATSANNAPDFLRALPHDFVITLGKQRKYRGHSLLDLLRALRNKRSHYEDMPSEMKRRIGGLPEGYLTFWTRRFPNLLLTCWKIVEDVQWVEKDRFKRYYSD